MPNESFRYSKQISDQGRERSVEVRRDRAALKERLKAGEISPAEVLNDGGNVAAKIRLFAFLKNCPGVGAVGARTLLRALGLSETKTIRSLGPVQKTRILTMLELIANGVRVDRVAETIMSER
ncbi:hypothetical protein [Collinsella aerofaciens]|uniref:hypothetical protein n=1 Tax=Collinsella aerofaciens TaxID=74426 RepID=UPI00189AF6ED|nr:hypothetical protein [Collinsella aerofaciens]MDB1920737.1 hypothetical protein [Collinsella aerofaciens]